MIRTLTICMALATSFSVLSQSKQTEEKTPRFLIASTVEYFNGMLGPGFNLDSTLLLNPFTGVLPWAPLTYSSPPYETTPYITQWDWSMMPFTVSAWIADRCGEHFYDNGNLQSRCACDADSVLHGKAVSWEENGRISSVKYYSKGKIYTQKYYSEGRVTELCNYAYRNGEQLLHGEHIEYSSDGKTIGKYYFGKKTGPFTTYINGKKSSITTYKNDLTIRDESFDTAGKSTSLSTYDDAGNPSGEWYEYQEYYDEKEYTVYENGKKKYSKRYKSGVLINHQEFDSNSNLISQISYFPNGEPQVLFKIDATGVETMKQWNQEGILINDFLKANDKFIGKGFYTSNTITTRYEQKFNSNGSDYLECWTVVSDDTTEFYYARNEGNSSNHVIAKNYFAQHNGRAVKSGLWKTYENNQLTSEITYLLGTKNGKAVYYDTTKSEPTPYLVGSFNNNLRNGLWTLRNDTILIETEYQFGILDGRHNVSSRSADTTLLNGISQLPQDNRTIDETLMPIVSCNYSKGLLHEKITTHWANGQKHLEGYYYNGVLSSIWREYYSDGGMYRAGTFTDGIPTGKWYLFIMKKNWEIKKKRERGDIVVPEIKILMIENVRPEFLELTGDPIAS